MATTLANSGAEQTNREAEQGFDGSIRHVLEGPFGPIRINGTGRSWLAKSGTPISGEL